MINQKQLIKLIEERIKFDEQYIAHGILENDQRARDRTMGDIGAMIWLRNKIKDDYEKNI